MQSADRAVELLRQTEVKLRDLLSEAASSADYSSVVQIASWARAVRDLVGSKPTDGGSRAIARVTGKTKKVPVKAPTPKRSANRAEKSYPIFFRRGDQLIRVAWSRKEKDEYLHKVPYGTAKAVITALVEKGSEGRVFSTDELLPLQNSDDAVTVPDYQVYVVISLLKQVALIDTHGRRGYSIPRIAHFLNEFESVWNKLPER